MNRNIALLILIFITTFFVNAQMRTISGDIFNADGVGMEGVVVMNESGEYKTVSDKFGSFNLVVPDSVDNLRFVHPDMKNASATIGINDQLIVSMAMVGTDQVYDLSLDDLLKLDIKLDSVKEGYLIDPQ